MTVPAPAQRSGPVLCESEDGAEMGRVVLNRDPMTVVGLPADTLPIDIGNRGSSQGDRAAIHPFKETAKGSPDRAGASRDCGFPNAASRTVCIGPAAAPKAT